MRLVFVHGINNQGSSSAKIVQNWTASIEMALNSPGLLANIERLAPFYGDVLEAEERAESVDELVAMGSGVQDPEMNAFLNQAISEVSARAGVTEAMVATALQQDGVAIPQGFPPFDRRFIAILRLLEGMAPWLGDATLRLLSQAYVYLKRPGTSAKVDSIVAPVLKPGSPTVIVSHSLGTVITFKLLRNLAAAAGPRTPLYTTLGSPLAIQCVKGALGKPRLKPACVDVWLNARDPDDFITLGEDLDAQTFAATITNIANVRHLGFDKHSVDGYLSDRRIAEAIGSACGVWPTQGGHG